MWTDIASGVARSVGPLLIAWLVKKGLTPEQAGWIAEWSGNAFIALVGIAAAGWSIKDKIDKQHEIAKLRAEVMAQMRADQAKVKSPMEK